MNDDESQCVLTRAADELADRSAVSVLGGSAADLTDAPPRRRARLRAVPPDWAESRPLDELTRVELESVVGATVAAGSAARFTIIRSPAATFEPVDPGDRVFDSSFTGHRRRPAGEQRLSESETVDTVIDLFHAEGWSVRVTDAPVVLDDSDPRRAIEWLQGQVQAAVVHRPALREWADEYLRTRGAQLADGTLRIVVHTRDLLAWSP